MSSLPFNPCQVLNSGCCFIRYVGMNQPIRPITPFEPSRMIEWLERYFWLTLRSMLFQSSGTTSTLPSDIAWNSGVLSGSFSMFTLQPRFFSSTYLRTYTFAVAPAHAFSSNVTVPHPALFELPPASALADTARALTTASAIAATTQRLDHLLPDIRPSLAVGSFRIRCSPSTDVICTPLVGPADSSRDPVERNPKRQYGERREHAEPEVGPGEPLRDLVSEPGRADETSDHDDREHHDDPLVDAEHDRVLRERDLHLHQDLPPRGAERLGRLDRVCLHVPDAALDESGDDRERVEHARDHARDDRDWHQVDERDQVDELRQGLEDVVDGSEDLREHLALRRADSEPDAYRDGEHGRDEHLGSSVHRGVPLADDTDQRQHEERRDRSTAPADDERHEHDPGERYRPRRLDEKVAERDEPVLDDVVADPARDREQPRVRILDVVEDRLQSREQPVTGRFARVVGADAREARQDYRRDDDDGRDDRCEPEPTAEVVGEVPLGGVGLLCHRLGDA